MLIVSLKLLRFWGFHRCVLYSCIIYDLSPSINRQTNKQKLSTANANRNSLQQIKIRKKIPNPDLHHQTQIDHGNFQFATATPNSQQQQLQIFHSKSKFAAIKQTNLVLKLSSLKIREYHIT